MSHLDEMRAVGFNACDPNELAVVLEMHGWRAHYLDAIFHPAYGCLTYADDGHGNLAVHRLAHITNMDCSYSMWGVPQVCLVAFVTFIDAQGWFVP